MTNPADDLPFGPPPVDEELEQAKAIVLAAHPQAAVHTTPWGNKAVWTGGRNDAPLSNIPCRSFRGAWIAAAKNLAAPSSGLPIHAAMLAEIGDRLAAKDQTIAELKALFTLAQVRKAPASPEGGQGVRCSRALHPDEPGNLETCPNFATHHAYVAGAADGAVYLCQEHALDEGVAWMYLHQPYPLADALIETEGRLGEARKERDAALSLLALAPCPGGDELHPLGPEGVKASLQEGDGRLMCESCRDWQAGRM